MIHISQVRLRNFKSFKAVNADMPKTFMCLAGPNGSGKCVDGDTKVYLADGGEVKIRDLVNQAIENGHVNEIDDGFVAQSESPKEILSIDPKTLKIQRKFISAYVKRKTPKKMLRVKTRAGKEIIATEYHPFFILENDSIKPIRADQLKEKIRIATPRRLPVNIQNTLFLGIIDMLGSTDDIYVPYNEKAAKIIKAKKEGMTWNQLENAIGIPKVTLDSFIHSKQAIQFSYLVKTLRFCGLNNLEISQIIITIKGNSGGSFLKFPWRNSNDFCRFMGYLLAEGSISKSNNQIRFTNGNEEIISDFVSITKSVFGLEAHVYKYKKGSSDAIINSVPLRNILLKFGMHYGGSEHKNIPEIILTHSTNENLANLLSGLFSGDGYVSKNNVEITLKSKYLIDAIESILLRFGVVPRRSTVTKTETKTKFVGTYFKLSISEIENLRLFDQNVRMVHKEKSRKLHLLIQKQVNPNVDLIEANHLVKEAVVKLGINVKKGKKEFSRLDAYCYNQCLPSRYGIKHLISKVLRPMAIQKKINVDALEKLELLCESDIFWDEIQSIETIKPREEWVYDLAVDETHNFIANGIIIHNSNFTDGIRFVLGEIALKSLRAKKVRDLIHTGAKTAEVTLNFDGDEQIEIKRAIREDGKILYKLNGVKATRSAILDFLRKYNLDDSGRNIIAQGEVSRIINMGGKERRTIIDSVAGISDFEAKKKESLGELDTVDSRIKDSNLVLGERQAFLGELEREKEAALKYKEARKNRDDSKGTFLKTESERLKEELFEVDGLEKKANSELAKRTQDIAEIDNIISEKENERGSLSRLLQEKQQTSSLVRKIEELKASVGSKSQSILDKKESIQKGETELKGLIHELHTGQKELDSLSASMEKIKHDLSKLETQNGEKGMVQNAELDGLRKSYGEASELLSHFKEELISLKSAIASKEEIIKIKKQELSRLDLPKDGISEDSTKEAEALRKAAKGLAEDIDSSFQRTKEINVEISKIDREMLDLKEEASIFKVRASPQLANPALQLIASMKEKKTEGIHGIVADLIQFEPKYASAVEAAAGSRLLYVVVDDVDVATSVIEKLKIAKTGRATFIPIQQIRVSKPVESGGFGSVLDVVNCNNEVRRAIEHIFAETLLVEDIAAAKRLGIGNHRMVTYDGEIFERSGIVSGGRAQSSILGGNQLKKLETKIMDMKSAKESLIQELYSLRESESACRARKSEIEIKAKTLEIEMRANQEEQERIASLLKAKDMIESDITNIEKEILHKGKELEKTDNEIIKIQERILQLKEKLDTAAKRYEHESEESNKKRTELASKLSSLSATLEGKANELEIRKRELTGKESRKKEIEKENKEHVTKIEELSKHVTSEQDELLRLEEKISTSSKEIEELFGKMKLFENEMQSLGKQRGEKRIALDKLNKDLNQFAVKRATISTRLDDVMSEFSGYPEFEFLQDMKKEDLMKMMKESEAIIASLPNVNMAAIEMYDKKKAEIEGVEEKIAKLEQERNAILDMIAEIDQHKKDAFYKTYYEVSDNFKKMFTYLHIGEGHLYLDKPSEPFESGLHIKLKRTGKDGKEHEHTIDSLSGGENSLVALMFIFALQFFKPAPFYILDEVDAALDKENSKNLSQLVSNMAKDSQFMVVSHNDLVMTSADTVFGVTKVQGVSKLVGVKMEQKTAS